MICISKSKGEVLNYASQRNVARFMCMWRISDCLKSPREARETRGVSHVTLEATPRVNRIGNKI